MYFDKEVERNNYRWHQQQWMQCAAAENLIHLLTAQEFDSQFNIFVYLCALLKSQYSLFFIHNFKSSGKPFMRRE